MGLGLDPNPHPKHEPLSRIPPQFEQPLPPLNPAVFPPSLREPNGPPLELLICRVDGKFFAMDSECPHEGGRMAEGPLMDGRTVHCPLHLYRFEPGSGEAVEVDCPPAKTFEVELRDGRIWVWVYGRPS